MSYQPFKDKAKLKGTLKPRDGVEIECEQPLLPVVDSPGLVLVLKTKAPKMALALGDCYSALG